MQKLFLTFILASSLSLLACSTSSTVNTSRPKMEQEPVTKAKTTTNTSHKTPKSKQNYDSLLGLPPLVIPADNPQTAAKIKLGKRLFEDKRFSGDGTVNCQKCHDPSKGFADQKPLAEGIGKQLGTRNSPTVINAAYFSSQFWDGRQPSLEKQSKDPFLNPIEHGLKDHQKIMTIVRTDPQYRQQFEQVFSTNLNNISMDHVAKAIASFERSVIAGNSPFDRYQYGGDPTAMSASAIKGLALFRGKARCVSCHTIEQTNATFTDNRFHNLGVSFHKVESRLAAIIDSFIDKKQDKNNIDEAILTKTNISELGRYAITQDPSDLGRFKTSTLRNIALTAPYMHDGSLARLKDVIELYNRGGDTKAALDGGIRPLNLTEQEKRDLIAFLESLTSDRFNPVAINDTGESNE
ncbi:MAG: cytochrome c peroxidase [Methylococcaceae bacterium]